MSGGAFNYAQHSIRDIIDKLDRVMEQQNQLNPDYGKDIWEPEFLREDSLEVQLIIAEGIHALKRAYIFAQRIDWYLSGDDGEESLYRRLLEELNELEGGKNNDVLS
jgi:hypothetical protein